MAPCMSGPPMVLSIEVGPDGVEGDAVKLGRDIAKRIGQATKAAGFTR